MLTGSRSLRLKLAEGYSSSRKNEGVRCTNEHTVFIPSLIYDENVWGIMIDERSHVHAVIQKALCLLADIEMATDRFEAIKIEYSSHALLWDLEAHGALTQLDSANLGIVFQMALEKRLHELAFI